MELLYDLALPLLGVQNTNSKRYMHRGYISPMFTTELFTIGKTWKQLGYQSINQ